MISWKTIALAGAAGSLAVAAPASSAEPLRSDTLQALGVGARSIGLGGAFVALAEDDVTAAFWNPAGLTTVERKQFAMDFRQLMRTELNNLSPTSGSANYGSTGLQFGFVGFAYPLGKSGTVAFSRTLGGYEQTEFHQQTAQDGLEIARYWYNTLAYGRLVMSHPQQDATGSRDIGELRLGLAVHYVQLNTLFASDSGPSFEDSGDGVTFSLGALYTPPLPKRSSAEPNTSKPSKRRPNASAWQFGANYLHPTHIGGLSELGPVFGDLIGGRASAGAAYFLKDDVDGRRLLAATEVRNYFGSDRDAVEDRGDVTDFHVGLEYRLPRGAAVDEDNKLTRAANSYLYFRSGFYTRNSPNDSIFFDDRLATVGVGYERIGRFRADVALEISTETGEPMVTTSLRLNLGKRAGD